MYQPNDIRNYFTTSKSIKSSITSKRQSTTQNRRCYCRCHSTSTSSDLKFDRFSAGFLLPDSKPEIQDRIRCRLASISRLCDPIRMTSFDFQQFLLWIYKEFHVYQTNNHSKFQGFIKFLDNEPEWCRAFFYRILPFMCRLLIDFENVCRNLTKFIRFL